MSFWMYSNCFPLSVKSLWSFSWSFQMTLRSLFLDQQCVSSWWFLFFLISLFAFLRLFFGETFLDFCVDAFQKSISKSTCFLFFFGEGFGLFQQVSFWQIRLVHPPPKNEKKWNKKYELKTLGSFSQFAIPKNYEAIPPTKLKTKTWLFTKKMKLIRETPNPTTPAFLSFRSGTTNSIDTPSNWSSCFFFLKTVISFNLPAKGDLLMVNSIATVGSCKGLRFLHL